MKQTFFNFSINLVKYIFSLQCSDCWNLQHGNH